MVSLALADARHEWRSTLCLVLALAAVLAPLLVLFGLRFGVVQTLTDRLARDPRNLEIAPIGAGRFDAAWFDRAKSWPEVAFLVPRTRAIAASVDLLRPGGSALNVELVPTAPGDPLAVAVAPDPGTPGDGALSITLSGSVARKLGLTPGDALAGIVGRSVEGRVENIRLALRVGSVLPENAYPRDAAFVPVGLLDATESFRDGYAEPLLKADGRPRPEGARLYAGFRMYGRTIHDVPALRDRLRAEKVEVSTRAAEIEQLISLDRNLGLLFWLIAGIGTVGFLLSLGVSLWGAVERKRRDLATLRLLGFRARATVAFPVVQAAAVAVLGIALALAVFAVVARAINVEFETSLGAGEAACRLLPGHVAAAAAATIVCALLASALAGRRAARVDPAEGLREL
ncbi:MAG: ABC transporter permease [Rhodospirillales bacterium]|nr:MAG: ABC transporter permease [Rhodospirillales bacterium]